MLKKVASSLLIFTMILGVCTTIGFAEDKTEIPIMEMIEKITPEMNTNGAEKMFDGDALTYWQPAHVDDNGDWTVIEFKQPITFNSAIIYEERQYVIKSGIHFERLTYPVDKFQLQYSENGKDWKLFYSGKTIGEKLEFAFNTVTTKYLKIVTRPFERTVRISGLRLFYTAAKEGDGEIVISADSDKAIVDGDKVDIGRTPIIDNQDFFVPISIFSKGLGLSVNLNEAGNLAKISKSSATGTYYVSKNGSDDNDGSMERPFATINKAAQVLKAGDTCIIREGIYRETVLPKNSGEEGKPITYAAYPGETVTVSGTEVLGGEWSAHSGGVYKTTTQESKISQLFVDGRMMNIARFPNAEVDNLTSPNIITRVETGAHEFVTHNQLPEGDLDGATMHIWPGAEWITFEKEVVRDKEESNKLLFKEPFKVTVDEFNTSDYTNPRKNNPFYIYGKLALLDIPTEWVQEGNDVYLWTQKGDNPSNHTIEYKKRDWAFDIFDKSYIHMEGLNIFGASIRLGESTNCIIDKCKLKYISETNDKALIIAGDNNVVKNSLIAYAAGNAILTYGHNVTIENNIIHDFCTYGGSYAGVYIHGQDTRVTRNTIYNSGTYLIYFDGGRAVRVTIDYNHIYNGCNFGNDIGLIYTWGHLGEGSLIANNWIHGSKNGRGIYLDSFSQDETITRNVVYDVMDALRINSGDINCKIYNNIFLARNVALGGDPFPGAKPTHKGTIIANNILKGTISIASMGTSEAPTLSNNVEAAVNLQTYFAENNAEVVDKGMAALGFTDGFAGKAPDVGAYEKGGEYWIPGADWTIDD